MRLLFMLIKPQAISRGITKASVGVNTYNLETVPLDEVEEAVRKSDGFIIGTCVSRSLFCMKKGKENSAFASCSLLCVS